MVDELAVEIGYQSHEDRQLFKGQVKKHLGNESIADMKTYSEISIKIEELAKFAATHFNYHYPPHD